MKVTLPTSWDDVTVKEWQAISKIVNEERDDYLTECGILSILSGLDVDDIMKLTRKSHGDAMRSIEFLKTQPTGKAKRFKRINGRLYYFERKAANITGGQYIDIQHYLKGDFTENLHHLLACFALRVKWNGRQRYTGKDHEEVAKDMQELPMSFVKPLTDFFLQDYLTYAKGLADYLEREGKRLKRIAEKRLKHSSRGGGGYTPLTTSQTTEANSGSTT